MGVILHGKQTIYIALKLKTASVAQNTSHMQNQRSRGNNKGVYTKTYGSGHYSSS